MSAQVAHRKKTSMSWVDLKIWLEEQKELIIHSYIDNLYYIKEASVLVLKLYNSTKNAYFWLIIEPSKRVSTMLTDLKFDEIDRKVQNVWRALLKDCFITNTSQIPCERILYLDLNCRSTLRKLVIELLPRGVLCVLDSQGKILLCNVYKSMKDRVLKPGLLYRTPPTMSRCTESLLHIKDVILSSSLDITRVLIKELGLPSEIAETITMQCNLRNKKVENISEEDILCIDNLYKDLVLSNKVYKPCIVFDVQNTPIGFYFYVPPQFTEDRYRIELYKTINDAINKYFEEEFQTLLLSSISHELKKTIDSTKNAIEKINYLVNEMKRKLDELTVKITTINNYYLELEKVHSCVVNKVKTAGWSDVKKCDHVVEVLPEKGVYRVCINDIVLEFDVRKSFIENYNDIRKSVAGLEKSITKAEEEKRELSKKLQELLKELKLREAKVKHKLSRVREWYEAYIWYITSSGFLVIGGKDASQNIKIVKKIVEPSDVVLHADIPGASTIVIKTQNKAVDEESINEAAIIAACYSKAWKLKLTSVDVFWVYGSQVSLSPPSGQYLPKGSYMVYGERNYIRNVKLCLAVGIEIFNEFPRVIIGPENVIDKRAVAHFVVVPGDEDPKDIAKNFVEFLKSKNLVDIVATLDINEIAQRLPGKCYIIKKVVKLSDHIQRNVGVKKC